jgi:hypothetical protein
VGFYLTTRALNLGKDQCHSLSCDVLFDVLSLLSPCFVALWISHLQPPAFESWVRRVIPVSLRHENPLTFGVQGRGLWCIFQICFDMGDDHLVHLRLRANYESHCLICRQVLDALEDIGQLREPEDSVVAFGGFEALSRPFIARLGRSASGQTRWLASTDRPSPSHSCSATRSTSGRPVVTDASWPTGSRWPQKERLADGFGGRPWSLFCHGEVSASASSTSMLLWV